MSDKSAFEKRLERISRKHRQELADLNLEYRISRNLPDSLTPYLAKIEVVHTLLDTDGVRLHIRASEWEEAATFLDMLTPEPMVVIPISSTAFFRPSEKPSSEGYQEISPWYWSARRTHPGIFFPKTVLTLNWWTRVVDDTLIAIEAEVIQHLIHINEHGDCPRELGDAHLKERDGNTWFFWDSLKENGND